MTGKHFLIATAITTALLISVGAFAGGGMGGGQEMMGGQGHGMMGSDRFFSSPWTSQPQSSPTDQNNQQERAKLREEIRDKRQELSELYRSEKPDKELVDRKIAELNALETAYDQNLAGAN